MGAYRRLPIWKAAFDLAVHLEKTVRRFSRYHKYTLGGDLRRGSQRLCVLVARAGTSRGEARAAALEELTGAVEEMKTLLILAQEIRAFGHFDDFAAATDLIVALGKQSGGWRRRGQPEAVSRQGEGVC